MEMQMPLVNCLYLLRETNLACQCLLVEHISESEQHIRKWTRGDPVLSAVLEFIRTG